MSAVVFCFICEESAADRQRPVRRKTTRRDPPNRRVALPVQGVHIISDDGHQFYSAVRGQITESTENNQRIVFVTVTDDTPKGEAPPSYEMAMRM